jgi:hypothetical protein
MGYTKQVWENGPDSPTPLNATRLNHIENGLESAHDTVDGLALAVAGLIPEVEVNVAPAYRGLVIHYGPGPLPPASEHPNTIYHALPPRGGAGS